MGRLGKSFRRGWLVIWLLRIRSQLLRKQLRHLPRVARLSGLRLLLSISLERLLRFRNHLRGWLRIIITGIRIRICGALPRWRLLY